MEMRALGKGAKIMSTMLVVVCFLCGICLLYFGMIDTIKLNETSKNYESTSGYLWDYRLYRKGEYDTTKKTQKSDTYTLIYNYMYADQEYKVETDYGTSFVPEIGSEIEVRFNPENPQQAIIVGPNKNSILLFAGGLFTGVPLIFILFFLSLTGRFKKLPVDIIGVVMGIVFLFAGYGALYMITGQFSIGGIVRFFATSFTFPLLIPLLLIAAGAFMLFKSLFFAHAANAKDDVL